MAEASAGKHTTSSEPAKSSRKSIKALVAILVLCAIAVAGYFAYTAYQQSQATPEPEPEPEAAEPEEPANDQPVVPEVVKVANPIDFATLQAQNSDTVGYIVVPDTNVNYPVLRSATDDSFYLQHNFDGGFDFAGAIYMEMQNSPLFTDPVTVLYGHTIASGDMFTTLHNFEDTAFFNAHPTFTVYIPGHILTYTIVSIYKADTSHILNTHDLNTTSGLLSYFATVQNPDAEVKNERTTPETTLTANSKLLQLSTCMTNDIYDNRRYVVSGVLTSDQPTY